MTDYNEFADQLFRCSYCGREFTKLGDKFRHVAAEHNLPSHERDELAAIRSTQTDESA